MAFFVAACVIDARAEEVLSGLALLLLSIVICIWRRA